MDVRVLPQKPLSGDQVFKRFTFLLFHRHPTMAKNHERVPLLEIIHDRLHARLNRCGVREVYFGLDVVGDARHEGGLLHLEGSIVQPGNI